jgi:NAD(P)-dependent dehydrogenase (short-subunit alcohol dehydrogenase family)
MKISGSKAVVTGGASGIGRSIAEELVARGARVLIADIDDERAQTVAEEIGHGVVPAPCDVSNHDSVLALADTTQKALGGVDLVFANAGVNVGGPLLDAKPDELDWQFAVNVRGTWNTLSVFGKRMRDGGKGGHLCLTGSEHSLGMQHPGIGFYSASKHAVLGMADVFRAELPPNMTISVLCPGLVATDLHLSKRHGPLPPENAGALAVAGALMARGMPASDVARAAVDGVERGDFLIVTHAIAFRAAKRRYEEIEAAFAAQAPWTDGAERYDINALIPEVLKDFAARAEAAKA